MELDARTKAVIATLIEQRNQAFNTQADMAGEIAILRDRVDALTKEMATLKPEAPPA